MAPTIIHVNQHIIKRNRKTGEREPPIAVRKGRRGKSTYVNEYKIGNLSIVYKPDTPLPCGATVWIELD
jgi:hypothetical protein